MKGGEADGLKLLCHKKQYSKLALTCNRHIMATKEEGDGDNRNEPLLDPPLNY